MPKTPQRPADPTQRWMTFVRNHAKAIIASDFFVVMTATFRLVYVFVVKRLSHFVSNGSANLSLEIGRDGIHLV